MNIKKFGLVLFIVILGCGKKSNDLNVEKNNFNRIDSLFDISKDTSVCDSLRFSSLNTSKILIDKVKNDSIKIRLLVQLSYYKLLSRDYQQFRQLNYEILKIDSKKSLNLNTALVNGYLGFYYQHKYKPDSAFYFYNNALNIYKQLDNNISEGNMLLSMATIQENEKDYTGSEINTIKAISKLKNSKKYRNLYLSYNNLGVIYSKLRRFNLSIKNHQNAIEYLNKFDGNNSLRAISFNNIGMVYSRMGDYKKSIVYFKKASNILKISAKTYALLLDNIAYSKFKLGELDEIPELFFKSLKIRDSLIIKDGQVMSNRHLSEYYLSQSDTIKAISYALISENIAKESNYNDGLLESYLLLSKIKPGKKGQKYLEKYIKLSDSLQQQERAIREKFTRIAYETDEIIIEKETETKKKWQVILLSGIGAGFSTLFIIYMRQRSRNKELEFIQDQDKANVEIYNLMLSQQKMFNKGSAKEKKRISKELHDDILSRLFGTRLSLDAINESKEEEDIADREKSIEELQLIEEDIRKISHNLSSSQFSENMSFATLVDQLLLKQSKITKFKYELSFSKNLNLDNISNTIKINCYRILQESIQNINKYAKATNVKINFSEENECLLCSIEDNGIGFNIKKSKKGIGIKNIKSRVKDLKGQVKFISKPENGTKIQVKVPL